MTYFYSGPKQLSFWFDEIKPSDVERYGYDKTKRHNSLRSRLIMKDIFDQFNKIKDQPLQMPTPYVSPYTTQPGIPAQEFTITYDTVTVTDNTGEDVYWSNDITQDLQNLHEIPVNFNPSTVKYVQMSSDVGPQYALRLAFTHQFLANFTHSSDLGVINLAKMYLFGGPFSSDEVTFEVFKDPTKLMTSVIILSKKPVGDKLFLVAEGQELPVKTITTSNSYLFF